MLVSLVSDNFKYARATWILQTLQLVQHKCAKVKFRGHMGKLMFSYISKPHLVLKVSHSTFQYTAHQKKFRQVELLSDCIAVTSSSGSPVKFQNQLKNMLVLQKCHSTRLKIRHIPNDADSHSSNLLACIANKCVKFKAGIILYYSTLDVNL